MKLTAKAWFLMAAMMFAVVGFMTGNVIGFVVAMVGAVAFFLTPAHWFDS